MTHITLAPITVENWKEAIALKVAPAQQAFVPENLYSIAEAQFYPEAKALAIYNDSEQMVGFALYGRDVQRGKWKIFRLMIDAAQQGKGYGRAAMVQLIAKIRQQPGCDEIWIAYQTDNHAARRLYVSLGFHEQSDQVGNVTAKLSFD